MGKIYLEGADNTRDLGGLKTTEGAVIKDKQLIRSNRLSRITQKDKILLETEYHLQKILDLRTPMEVEQEPDLEVAGAVYENIPMEDYLKTNKAAITRVEKLKKKLHLAGLHRERIKKIEGYFVAKEEFLNAALKTMKEEYGSINQFMIKGLNISMQQKEDFKQKVLE